MHLSELQHCFHIHAMTTSTYYHYRWPEEFFSKRRKIKSHNWNEICIFNEDGEDVIDDDFRMMFRWDKEEIMRERKKAESRQTKSWKQQKGRQKKNNKWIGDWKTEVEKKFKDKYETSFLWSRFVWHVRCTIECQSITCCDKIPFHLEIEHHTRGSIKSCHAF